MNLLEKKLIIEDVFKGLRKKEINTIKNLLQLSEITAESLNIAIEKLSPKDQWTIDNYLEKARSIQKIRFYIKRALLTSFKITIIMAICTFLYFILFK